MQISNVTMEDMSQALKELNLKYDGNIEYKRLEHRGHKIIFTLKVKGGLKPKDGIVKGAAINQNTERRTGAACWHSHGDLFEIILNMCPEAVITSIYSTIDKDGGNWTDFKLGSVMYPYYASEACNCSLWDDPHSPEAEAEQNW